MSGSSEIPNTSPPEWAVTAAKKALGSDASRWDVDYVARALVKLRREALEEAAKESESWWTLFNFDSFDANDVRRAANPNQIAERIRWLKTQEPKK